MVRAEAKEKYPDLVELVKDYRNTLPNSESYEELKSRVLTTWNDLMESSNSTIAVLTHGGPIRVIFREILKKEIKIADCGYVVFEKIGDELMVVKTEGILVGDNLST